ncbi:hypothetical protein [Dyadobacter sp. 676]|uniref:Uncharacterized protein n=1 Tax=Dyadobacter sp. 676 TaxID=3088362 RepID=A0AAU8FMB0_9BACT
MNQTQQKEQKWGFWLHLLNFLSLDSIARLIIQKILNVGEIQFSHHLLSFVIALSLAMIISYASRYRAWQYRVWTTGAIIAIWLLTHILYAVS